MIVVYGGTASGKSEVAENIATELSRKSGEKLFYLATMESQSEAAQVRIKHHKELRKDKGFHTIEEMFNPVGRAREVENGIVLVECVSNLVANILFEKYGDTIPKNASLEQDAKDIFDSVARLASYVNELIVVTNNVFNNGKNPYEWSDRYMYVLALVNRHLADRSDTFIEVTYGIGNLLKGEREIGSN